MEHLEERARDFALASMATAYPDDEFAETLRALGGALDAHEALGPLVARLADVGLDDLRGHWIELFDHGKGSVSLYETEYGRMRGMSKGNDLADLAGFYHAFGLDLDATEVHEQHDHVSVELEFYATLLAKERYLRDQSNDEGAEIVADARQKFLKDHLGGFVSALAGRVQEDATYAALFGWAASLVRHECELAGVVPPPLDYFADEEARSEMKCASLPVIQ